MEMHNKTHLDMENRSFLCRFTPSECPERTGIETGARASIQLLLVEHDPRYAAHIKRLTEEDSERFLQVEWTRWLDVAVQRLQEGGTDAVLLDISLPDVSGIEIFRAVHHAAPHLPVLIMADLDDETLACRLIREGAQDYLPKHALSRRQLSRSVRFALARNDAKRAGWSMKNLLRAGGPVCFPVSPNGAPQSRVIQPPRWKSSAQITRILFLENSDHDYRKLIRCLRNHKEQIRAARARSIQSAFHRLNRQPFDIVCLDYHLPDGNGHDFLMRMRESGLDIPSIVITAESDPMTAAQIIQAGAYDYLTKQKLSRSPLFRIIMNSLEKASLQKQIQEAQKRIVEMSILDDLTGLYNRRYFIGTLEKEISRAARYSSPLVLCMMDLDGFKSINDTYGHQAGDLVLRAFGEMLRRSIRVSDTPCRYGGEEFALLLPNTDPNEAKALGERLRDNLESRRFEWNGQKLQITLSLGLAPLAHGPFPSLSGLVAMADEALYAAKRQGKNTVVSWDESWRDQALGSGSAMKP